MPEYRRAFQPGGTFFLTLVTHRRARVFDSPVARAVLRESIELARVDRPFELLAVVLLPDHLHLLLTLPTDDADFSTRVGVIKARFTRRWLDTGAEERGQSVSRARQGYRGVWQKRFWEHVVRDNDDLIHCYDYIHYNPVKHGLASCPHAWQWSTFHRCVNENKYAKDWQCRCGAIKSHTPVSDIVGAEMD